MTINDPAGMTREEALGVLAERHNLPADEVIGPGVEAIIGRMRRGAPVSDQDLVIAVVLMPDYVKAAQQTILGAANVQVGEVRGGRPKYRLGWHEVGILLGFPGSTAYMRALKLARQVGVVPAVASREDD